MNRLLILLLSTLSVSASIPAKLIKDIPIPPGYSLATDFWHIKDNQQGVQVIFLRAFSNFGNDGALLLYDSTGANTSIIPLTSNIYHDVVLSTEIGVVSNTVVIVGTAQSAIAPDVVRHHLYQYTLGNQLPLPTSATLVTNFAFGATNLFGQSRIVEMTNGGMMIAINEEMTQNTLSLLYMFPNGTITNYGFTTFWGASGGNFPTLGGAASPDGTVWTFANKDAMNGTNVATQFLNNSNSNEGLFLQRSFPLVDMVGGVQTSYFEYNYPEAISDNTSNRMILAYCNPNYIQSGSDVFHRVTTVNVTGMLANTNHYLMSQSSNYVDRIARNFITQIGTNVILGYLQSFTNGSEQLNGSPFWLQSFNATEQNAPTLELTAAFATTVAYHPHRLDYGLQKFDGSYHLLLFGGTEYYVDPVTGNDSNDGLSRTTAWAHLPGTVGGGPAHQLVDGDTVTVKGGSTNNCSVNIDDTTYHGAANFDSITIRSGDLASVPWGTGRAIFDEQNTRFYGFGVGKGSGNPINGITIDGFEVRNIAAAASSGAPGNPGSCCVSIQPPPSGGVAINFVTVKRCYLHDAIRTVDDTGHGMEIGSSGNLLIYYNLVGPNIGTKGIEVSGVGGVISNNFIAYTGDHCLSLTRATNFDVCNNLIRQDGAQVHSPTFLISCGASMRNDVWNNVCFDAQTTANAQQWSSAIGQYNGSISNNFYHNTFGRLGSNNGGPGSGVCFGDGGTTGVTNEAVINNIVLYTTNLAGAASFLCYVNGSASPSTPCTLSYNDWWNGVANQTVCSYNDGAYHYFTIAGFSVSGVTFTGNQNLDPLLLGGTMPTGLNGSFLPNTTYFSLGAAPPTSVRATGNMLTGDATHGYNHSSNKFAFDITGLPRLNWSMGAYEWSSFPPPPYAINLIMSGKTLVTGKVFLQ